MIEQNAVAGENVVRLAVVFYYPVRIQLCYALRKIKHALKNRGSVQDNLHTTCSRLGKQTRALRQSKR